MGSKDHPWLTEGDPRSPSFHVPDLLPLPGFSVERLGGRQRLLEQIESYRRDLDRDLGRAAAHRRAAAGLRRKHLRGDTPRF